MYRITGSKYNYFYPIIKPVSEAAKKLNIDFIVIGATARDFLIEYVFDIDLNYRATQDIDVAFMIDKWEVYDEIMEILVNEYSFIDHPQTQRLIFDELPVDIIPYGKIAKNNEITWPSNKEIEMNVTGFEILFEKTFSCQYRNILFKIPQLEAFLISEIIAWQDRKYSTKKDREDIGIILYNYNDFYPNHLFDNFSELIDRPDYDYIKTGAILLGKRINIFLENYPILKKEVKTILEDEIKNEDNCLLAHNLGENRGYSENYKMLSAFYKQIKL